MSSLKYFLSVTVTDTAFERYAPFCTNFLSIRDTTSRAEPVYFSKLFMGQGQRIGSPSCGLRPEKLRNAFFHGVNSTCWSIHMMSEVRSVADL